MNDQKQITRSSALPSNLPAGAVAFQAAVDGKLTKEVWETILQAQIEKAKQGDRGAAKFLLEYAGGVSSMRGATFVQENHEHHHYADSETSPRLSDPSISDPVDRIPPRTAADFDRDRERVARRAATRASA
jgi:hypothetical protein